MAAIVRKLLLPDGTPASDAREKLTGKRVALYFSATWCGQCVTFEPSLAAFCKEAEAAGKPVQLILVSTDHDALSQARTCESLNALQIPFGSHLGPELKRRHRVWAGIENKKYGDKNRRSGIPALVVIDPMGEELAFVDAERLGADALKSWDLDQGAWGPPTQAELVASVASIVPKESLIRGAAIAAAVTVIGLLLLRKR
mmetsp:Transcript_23883/g.80170  ORF Transcript_23883/g.80170 Transcript_23883/m.80170 type:complete len:200 (+) Transcript_23883:81-680(+)